MTLEPLDRHQQQLLLSQMIVVARQAGEAAMAHYGQPQTRYKQDDSPLTQADLASHQALVRGISDWGNPWPVLSEEAGLAPWEQRRQWQRYWLLDPVDGTKEFIAENGEFTINIALIEQGVPLLGVVVAPALGKLYSGGRDLGAWLEDDSGLRAISGGQCGAVPRVVTSRSHPSAELAQWLSRYPKVSLIEVGSSLKLCLLAEGKADLYPRLGPTSEWDIAAAQAVLEGAGGSVRTLDDQPLGYNGKASVLNPHFIARCDG